MASTFSIEDLKNKTPEERFEIYKAAIIAIIHKHVPGCHIYLYGSRARQSNRKGSDIDLALDAGATIDMRIIAALNEDLEDSLVPFTIDLADLHRSSENFINRIKKDFKPWTN